MQSQSLPSCRLAITYHIITLFFVTVKNTFFACPETAKWNYGKLSHLWCLPFMYKQTHRNIHQPNLNYTTPLTCVLNTMWTPPGTTNAACSLRKSNTSCTVAENGRPRRRRQSLVFMPLMHGPGSKKGGWNGGCCGRGGSMIGGKLCRKLLYELRTCWTSLWEVRNSST